MVSIQIEHVNILVSDPQKTAALMRALFGWHIRWQGPAQNDGYTIHVGTDDHYLALYTLPHIACSQYSFEKGKPLNHICIQVDDLDVVDARVLAAGLKSFNHADYEPGRRFYFLD